MKGPDEDATDDGTPAEVSIPTMDEISSSDPGRVDSAKAGVVGFVVGGDVVIVVAAGEDMVCGRFENKVVVNATMDS